MRTPPSVGYSSKFSSSFQERFHHSKSYLAPEQDHLLLLMVKLASSCCTVALPHQYSSIHPTGDFNFVNCNKKPELCHRVNNHSIPMQSKKKYSLPNPPILITWASPPPYDEADPKLQLEEVALHSCWSCSLYSTSPLFPHWLLPKLPPELERKICSFKWQLSFCSPVISFQ